MNTIRWFNFRAGRLLWLAPAAMLLRPGAAVAASEQHFAVLQIGTRAYTNVTVTTKAQDYIFIVHAGGMNNIKLSQIPPDLREKLGYVIPPPTPTVETNAVSKWAKQVIPEASRKQIQQLKVAWEDCGSAALSKFLFQSTAVIVAALGIAFLFYLFGCYCSMLICQKAGYPPGLLIWLPVLQIIPLLRAAGMSPLWLVAWLVPGVNFVALVAWSINICKVRGKSLWLALWLVLPPTGWLAYLYLAFSSSPATLTAADHKTQLMTFETA